MEITLNITDARHLAGITAAREARNAMLPEGVGVWPDDPAGACETDEDYVRFIGGQAAESWAVQHVDE